MKPKTLTLVEPQTTRREQAAAVLRAKHYLLTEQAKRAVKRVYNLGASAAARRDRRLVMTGEAAYEHQWRDPVSTHPDAPQEDGFTLEISERQYRLFEKRRKRKAIAAYWEYLGPAPSCLPGDLVSASIFHRKIVSVMERGGWTHNEQTALADLERKWRRRARGEDPRFVLAGNRPGRLHRTVERRVRDLKNREG